MERRCLARRSTTTRSHSTLSEVIVPAEFVPMQLLGLVSAAEAEGFTKASRTFCWVSLSGALSHEGVFCHVLQRCAEGTDAYPPSYS